MVKLAISLSNKGNSLTSEKNKSIGEKMNNTDIIDFQSRFIKDFISWSKKHPEIAKDDEKLKEAAFLAQAKWYDGKKSWLNGLSPNEYFFNINDAKVYVSLLIKYIEDDISIPDPLMECLVASKDEVYNLLLNILNIENSDDITPDALSDVRAQIISIIEEMCKEHPYSRYIELLLEIIEPCKLSEAISSALESAKDIEHIKGLLYSAYIKSSGYSKMLVLDLLCSLPDDDLKTADIVLSELELGSKSEVELGVLAGYEATLMDERSLPLLKAYIEDPSIDYFTYTQLRYALEAITGELIDEKDFSGDADYDKIASLKEDDIFG